MTGTIRQGQFNRLVRTVTMNGATPVTVSAPDVTADSLVFFQLKTVGGTPSSVYLTDITPGTGFDVRGSAGNTGVYNYVVL